MNRMSHPPLIYWSKPSAHDVGMQCSISFLWFYRHKQSAKEKITQQNVIYKLGIFPEAHNWCWICSSSSLWENIDKCKVLSCWHSHQITWTSWLVLVSSWRQTTTGCHSDFSENSDALIRTKKSLLFLFRGNNTHSFSLLPCHHHTHTLLWQLPAGYH